jgi:hypothetical protein
METYAWYVISRTPGDNRKRRDKRIRKYKTYADRKEGH